MVMDLEVYFHHYQSHNHGPPVFLPKCFLNLGFLQVGFSELCSVHHTLSIVDASLALWRNGASGPIFV